MDVNIIPTDIAVGEENHYTDNDESFTTIEPSCRVSSYFSLFFCWPEYDKDWPYNSLREYHKSGGETIIYVGEDEGGCNATDAFFSFLNKHYTIVESHIIPRWSGIYDSLSVWKRK